MPVSARKIRCCKPEPCCWKSAPDILRKKRRTSHDLCRHRVGLGRVGRRQSAVLCAWCQLGSPNGLARKGRTGCCWTRPRSSFPVAPRSSVCAYWCRSRASELFRSAPEGQADAESCAVNRSLHCDWMREKPSPPPTPRPPAPADEPPAVLPVAPEAEGKTDPPTSRSASKASVTDLRKTADDPRADRAARAARRVRSCSPTRAPRTGRVRVVGFGQAGWLKAAPRPACCPASPDGYQSNGRLTRLCAASTCSHTWTGTRRGGVIGSSICGFVRRTHRSADEARAFLRGEKGVRGTPELIEFALCYPEEMGVDRIEHFGPKGMTVLPTG